MTHGLRRWLMVVTLTALAVASPAVRAEQTPQATFERARLLEENGRTLNDAIALYKQVVEQAGTNRPLAAQALLRMAEGYQKLGDRSSASSVYARIVREYADRPEAATARTRQGASPASGSGFVLRQAGTLSMHSWGTVSASGQVLYSGGDGFPHHLYLRDPLTGRDRQVTAKSSDGGVNALASAISRDATRAAYVACTDAGDCALWVASIRGNAPQASRKLPTPGNAVPLDWSPDGQSIAVVTAAEDGTRRLGLVDAESGALRVLKSLDWRGPTAAFFSPDGRDIAFDAPATETGSQRDVFVLAVDGSHEVSAVVDAAHDTVMGWTPDGDYLLFASDRRGARDLYRLRFDGRKPVGGPALAGTNIGAAISMGVSSKGELFLRRSAGGQDIEVAAFDISGAKVTAPTRPIRSFLGFNFEPAWSPDGKSLAYISRRGPMNERVLMIQDMAGGRERELTLTTPLQWIVGPNWHPNGRQLSVLGRDMKGRSGVFAIDVGTASVTPVALNVGSEPGEGGLSYEGAVWSPDGARLYFHSQTGAIREWTVATSSERVVATGGYGPISLSPNGQLIATSRPGIMKGPGTAPAGVVILSADGRTSRDIFPLARGEWVNNTPIPWTPDAKHLLVRKILDPKASKTELWLVPVDGSTPRKIDVNADRIAAYAPGKIRLSPDGRQLAYVVDESPGGVEMLIAENLTPAHPSN